MTSIEKIRKDYIGRINKAMDYIEDNLENDLSLETISQIACFSQFHFLRIFSAVTGETPNAFIIRKRIERIASVMLRDLEEPVTNLALKYGFKSGSSFSRAFKKFYGISPTEFREKGGGNYSRICKTDSKNGKEILTFEKYICSINNIQRWIKMNAQIEVKEMPGLLLAYVNHIGNFEQVKEAYEILLKWAGPKGLLAQPDMKVVTVCHDDPKVTDISKVRKSVGITINEEVKVDGEIGKKKVSEGKFAVGRFEVGVEEIETAWNSMCVWVTESGYKARDGEYYELFHNDHKEHPEQKFIMDICIPVE